MNPERARNQQRELAEQIFRLRFQLSTGQAEGVKKLREARKDLARVKTLLRAAGTEEDVMANETAAATSGGAAQQAASEARGRNWSAW